jgi:hypothetical protein
MNPNYTDIFGRLDQHNKKIRSLTHRVTTVEKTSSNTSAVSTQLKPGSFDKVTHVKNDYDDAYDSRDIIIEGVLELARGVNQGLYNAAIDSNWQNPGPANTLWSSPFINPEYTTWAPLLDIGSRTFDTWLNAVETPEGNRAPALQIGMPMVLKETTTGRMWLIKFTQWTPNNGGGGFSYERYEIFPTVNFEKPDGQTSTTDQISDGVWLARQNNGPLYNAHDESQSIVGVSPFNTRWNSQYTDNRSGYSGFGDLTNLDSRVYTDFTLALDYAVGNNVLDTPLIMHDLTTDVYYKFEFTGWTQGNNGGGFAYTRTAIPQFKSLDAPTTSTTNPLDAQGNFIAVDNSSNTVNVPSGENHDIPNFSGILIVNDHYDGSVEVWIAGGGNDTVLLSRTSYGPGPGDLSINGGIDGYTWNNLSSATGPFTFTVIKTRSSC